MNARRSTSEKGGHAGLWMIPLLAILAVGPMLFVLPLAMASYGITLGFSWMLGGQIGWNLLWWVSAGMMFLPLAFVTFLLVLIGVPVSAPFTTATSTATDPVSLVKIRLARGVRR
ncbi:MAG: hypothetical protein ACHQ2Y_05150 [Candidatus Lutacidiplasmatales archaeon]